jgi:hypothetical protein
MKKQVDIESYVNSCKQYRQAFDRNRNLKIFIKLKLKVYNFC